MPVLCLRASNGTHPRLQAQSLHLCHQQWFRVLAGLFLNFLTLLRDEKQKEFPCRRISLVLHIFTATVASTDGQGRLPVPICILYGTICPKLAVFVVAFVYLSQYSLRGHSVHCKSVSFLRRDRMMPVVNSTLSGGISSHLRSNINVHTTRVIMPIIELFKFGEYILSAIVSSHGPLVD